MTAAEPSIIHNTFVIERNYPQPPNVLVSNRSCSSDSSCTKSESMVWSSPDGQTLVVNYNDEYFGNGSDYSGTSYSTNGGASWTLFSGAPATTEPGAQPGFHGAIAAATPQNILTVPGGMPSTSPIFRSLRPS